MRYKILWPSEISSVVGAGLIKANGQVKLQAYGGRVYLSAGGVLTDLGENPQMPSEILVERSTYMGGGLLQNGWLLFAGGVVLILADNVQPVRVGTYTGGMVPSAETHPGECFRVPVDGIPVDVSSDVRLVAGRCKPCVEVGGETVYSESSVWPEWACVDWGLVAESKSPTLHFLVDGTVSVSGLTRVGVWRGLEVRY